MNSKKKLALSVTSWFCIREQGMKDMELLCRASAFLLKANASPAPHHKFEHKYHVVTVSHAIAPWRWPKLYPQEWLRFVNETHTHYTLEARYPDGTFINQLDLKPRSFHHHHHHWGAHEVESAAPNTIGDAMVGTGRDLAALHLCDEDAALRQLNALEVEVGLQLLLPDADLINNDTETKHTIHIGQPLHFHGHEVVGAAVAGEEFSAAEDNRVAVPTVVRGLLQGRTPHQTFARTLPQALLADGMCGGPVVVPAPAPATASVRGGVAQPFAQPLAGVSDTPQAAAELLGSSGVETGLSGRSNSAVQSEKVRQRRRRGVPLSEVSSFSKTQHAQPQQQPQTPTQSQSQSESQPGPALVRVVGMLEGIVPPLADMPGGTAAAASADALSEVRGSAVFVEAPVIHRFLAEVEEGRARVVLQGGQAADAVGKDQDPAKMDLSKIF